MGLDEVGELSVDELSTWAAWFARRRRQDELRWDERFGTLCSTVALFATGSNRDWQPEVFFPSLRKDTDRGGWITDEDQMRKVLMAWTAAVGGTVKQKGSD